MVIHIKYLTLSQSLCFVALFIAVEGRKFGCASSIAESSYYLFVKKEAIEQRYSTLGKAFVTVLENY